MEWLKKLLTNIWFYVALFALSLLIPFGINEIYKIGQGWDNAYITLWDASDVFSYFGSYLSFFGSIVLGAVAVIQTADANKQTAEANKQTERANELAAQMQKLEQAKFVSMVSLITNGRRIQEVQASQAKTIHKASMSSFDYFDLCADTPKSTRYFILDAEVENNSEYPLVHIGIHPGIVGNSNCILYGMRNLTESAVYIAPNSKRDIRIAIPADLLKKAGTTALSLSIVFTNIFDYQTRARLDIETLGVVGKYPTTTYRLAKFVDIKPKDSISD